MAVRSPKPTKLFNIFILTAMALFDRYDEGYDKGYNDALDGRSRNYGGAAASLTERAFDSWVEGYNEGYRKGLYDKQNRG